MKSIFTTTSILVSQVLALPHLPSIPGANPNMFVTFEEMCLLNGYTSESHTVKTDDGYVLELMRITGTFNQTAPGAAVLMMPGLGTDFMEFLGNEPDQSAAYLLADAGYDVWLGNNRGTRFGLNHVQRDKSQKSFWEFYQEEMGRFDVPANIDYVLQVTGQETLTYLGHSQGTTQFFLGASLMPDYYKERVNLMVALAPVASTSHIVTPAFVEASQHLGEIETAVVDVLGIYNLNPNSPLGVELLLAACEVPHLNKVCKEIFSSHWGGRESVEGLRIAVSNTFWAGMGYMTPIYYGQMIRDGEWFRQYDYGTKKNQQIYNQDTPPMVPLDQYAVPTGLFSGDIDPLANPTDVAWLSEQIHDYVVFENQYENFDHITFSCGANMTYFTNDVIPLIQQYNPVVNVDDFDVVEQTNTFLQ